MFLSLQRSDFSLKTTDTMSLDYSSVCNIGSSIVVYGFCEGNLLLLLIVMSVERYIFTQVAVMVYLVEIK